MLKEGIVVISEKDYYELSLFRNGPIALDGRLSDRMKALIEEKYIVVNSYDRGHPDPNEWTIDIKDWRISDKGKDALQDFERELEQKAKDERDKQIDRKIAIVGVAASIVTFIIGLFVEHFSGIIGTVFGI